MTRAAELCLGIFLFLLGLGYLGVSIPTLVLAVFAILAGILVILAGIPISRGGTGA